MADNKEIDIDIIVKHLEDPNISVFARVSNFANYYKRAILGNPIMLAIIALGASIWKVIGSAKETEYSINSLNRALINQGIYSKSLSESYQAMAKALQTHSRFSDEEIISAQAAIQPFLGQIQITKEVIKAIADFATVKNMNLVNAAELFGKAIDGDREVLKKYGITIDMNASKSDKLQSILTQVNNDMGGQAEASTKGLGQLHVFTNQMEDISSDIGKKIAPIVIMLVENITALIKALTENTVIVYGIGRAVDIIQIGTALSSSVITVVINKTSIFLRSSFKAFSNVLKGKFKVAAQEMINAHFKMIELDKFAMESFINETKEIWNTRSLIRGKNLKEQERMLKKSLSNIKERAELSINEQKDFFKARSAKEIYEKLTINNLKQNTHYVKISQQAATTKDINEKQRLELEKRKIWDEEFNNTEVKYGKTQSLFAKFMDESQLMTQKKAFERLSELQASKASGLIIVGKTAAIASIIIDTAIAIPNTAVALSMIFPPAYPTILIAVTVALSAFAEEQIFNIIDSSLESPGSIGFKTLGKILDMVSVIIKQIGKFIISIIGLVGDMILSFTETFKKTTQAFSDALSNAIPVIGHIVGFMAEIVGEIVAFIGQVINAVLEVIAAVVAAIFNAIAAVFDFLFGWLFAEGGVVIHRQGTPLVIPLKDSGISFSKNINVTIMGGLIPSRREAQRLAERIRYELNYG